MRSRLVATFAILALALSACTAPTKQYISASGFGMYFALPKDWSEIPVAQLRTAESGWSDDAGQVFQQSVQWQGSWTAGAVNANAVFAAKPPARPVAFAFVRDLISVEQQGLGGGIATALQDVVIPASTLTSDELTTKTVVHGNVRGILQTATYVTGGARQTIMVESVLAAGKNRVYVVFVRCTAKCFSTNMRSINEIFASLTFKEQRA